MPSSLCSSTNESLNFHLLICFCLFLTGVLQMTRLIDYLIFHKQSRVKVMPGYNTTDGITDGSLVHYLWHHRWQSGSLFVTSQMAVRFIICDITDGSLIHYLWHHRWQSSSLFVTSHWQSGSLFVTSQIAVWFTICDTCHFVSEEHLDKNEGEWMGKAEMKEAEFLTVGEAWKAMLLLSPGI